ncbi:uncharacterized protein IWZ02DRAFT_49809 [Phyllosticta citriasiana]|uniref:uncharacterized protein n=1 Tax=Phyllosticta citriasiana TaxID=595635 RepID=UPI0030FDEC4D
MPGLLALCLVSVCLSVYLSICLAGWLHRVILCAPSVSGRHDCILFFSIPLASSRRAEVETDFAPCRYQTAVRQFRQAARVGRSDPLLGLPVCLPVRPSSQLPWWCSTPTPCTHPSVVDIYLNQPK